MGISHLRQNMPPPLSNSVGSVTSPAEAARHAQIAWGRSFCGTVHERDSEEGRGFERFKLIGGEASGKKRAWHWHEMSSPQGMYVPLAR